MTEEIQVKRGWTLKEAVDKCADPDLQSEHAAALQQWQSIGAPTRFTYRNTSFWESADHDNARTRAAQAKYDRAIATLNHVFDDLRRKLESEQLLSWGRRESALAELRPIPPSAWRVLRMIDLERSIAQEKTNAKTQILDVQIFPILEAPNAIDHLAGMTFLEACRRCVLEDPQVVAARKRAFGVGGTPARLGDQWEPYRAVWRVDSGENSLHDEVADLTPFLDDAEDTDASIKVREADHLLRTRFTAFVDFLSRGALEAHGIPQSGGGAVPIPRSVWQRRRTFVDLENGDLLELGAHARDRTTVLRPIFHALILRKAAAQPRSEAIAFVGPSSKAIVRGRDREAARTACLAWLISEMRKNSHIRPKPKREWLKEALQKWPGTLSERAFDIAWMEAVRLSGASSWARAGAPRKSART